jgi:hypothetical protein
MKFQSLVVTILLLIASFSRATVAGDYGKKLLLDDSKKLVDFTVYFNLGSAPSVQGRLDFLAMELYGPGHTKAVPVFFAFLEKTSCKNLTSWTNIPSTVTHIDGASGQSLNFRTLGKEASDLLVGLKESVLVFALNPMGENFVPTAYVDVAELCQTHIENFSSFNSKGQIQSGCP